MAHIIDTHCDTNRLPGNHYSWNSKYLWPYYGVIRSVQNMLEKTQAGKKSDI